MIDTKTHVLDEALVSKLTAPGLNMQEIVHGQVDGPAPNIWFYRSDPIDDILTSSNLGIIEARYLPYHIDMGNHRQLVATITMYSLLGRNLPKIIPPQPWRPNYTVERIRDAHVLKLEGLLR